MTAAATTYERPFSPVGMPCEFGPVEEFTPEQRVAYSAEALRTVLGGLRRICGALIVRHLHYCFQLRGGLLDPDGNLWVYKCASAFREQFSKLTIAFNADFVPDEKSFQRAARGLALLGIVTRCLVKFGRKDGTGGGRQYAYRPGPNWDKAIAALDMEGVLSDPSDNQSHPSDTAVRHAKTMQEHLHGREEREERKRRERREVEYVAPPVYQASPEEMAWMAEHFPSYGQAQPDTAPPANPPDEPIAPVEPETRSATDELSAVLYALNDQRNKGYEYDLRLRVFRSRWGDRKLFPDRTVEQVAQLYSLSPKSLRAIAINGRGPDAAS